MKSFNPRTPHLLQLWSKLTQLEALPQLDRWIAEEFRRNTKFGSRDRKWYSEMLFSAIRFATLNVFCETCLSKDVSAIDEYSLPALIEDFKQKFPTPKSLLESLRAIPPLRFFAWTEMRIGRLDDMPALEVAESHRIVFEKVEVALKKSASLASQLLLAGVPLWFENLVVERSQISQWSPSQTKLFIERQNVRPPLWLRINHLEKSASLFSELEREGFRFENIGAAVSALGVKGIFTMQSYRDGVFEIQDLASQGIGSAIACKPGELVWDCCAGGGGKTLQIASALRNKGAVYASDIREYKLEEVKKRARRAGFHNVRCLVWNGESLPEFPREVTVRGGFDHVLVDAPCSSTGTWRRNPDAKYRMDESNIENLTKLQLNLLLQASKAVRIGGTLCYSTCSFLTDENEGVVKRFLKDNAQFEAVSATLLGSPEVDADTMFVAVFKRLSVSTPG